MKNNMMKKLLTLVLAGAMTLSLAACGAKDPQPDSCLLYTSPSPRDCS